MIGSFFANHLLTLFLCCTTPCLAFTGVNYIRFSRRQAFYSICLCLLCALILSPIFVLLPSVVASLFVCFLFCIFSEGFLSSIFTSRLHKFIFFVSFTVINVLVVWQFGYAPMNLLLIFYASFSFFDIYKNSKLPKEHVFCIAGHQVNSATSEKKNRYNVKLKKKNDIFIIFLESMHGREALKALYDVDDVPLFGHLEKTNFTVYPHSYSNACETLRSCATLLNMTPYDELPKDMPNAIQILSANGYELQIFDSIIYTFQHAVRFSNYFNMTLPNYVARLFDFATPFFTHTLFAMKLVQNIDPFDDRILNEKILRDLKKRIVQKYNAPQCYLVRMGAQHSAGSYSFGKNTEEWKEQYRSLYLEAAKELQEAVDMILLHNPDAIIGIMGDHGAYSLRGAWEGKLSPVETLLEKGIDPLLVNMDVASILFAVRFPDVPNERDEIRSPCNLFRYIFRNLGGEGKFLEYVSDDTIFYTQKGTQLLVKDGKSLKKWEQLSRDAYAEYKIKYLSHGDFSSNTYKDIVRLFESSLQIEEALEVCESAIAKFPEDLELRSLTIKLLIRIGKIDVAEKFALSLLSEHLYEDYICIKALQGKHVLAQHLLEDKYAYLKYPEKLRAYILCLAGEKEKALDAAEAHFKYTLINFQSLPTEENVSALSIYLEHLEASGQALKALSVYKGMNKSQYPYAAYMVSLEVASALLALRASDSKEYVKITKSNIGRIAMVHLLLLGVLERQGKIKELIDVVEEKYDILVALPVGKAQLGLLAIRHSIDHPLFKMHKKDAYEHLRDSQKMLKATKLFDEAWYKERYKGIIGDAEPFMHYLHHRILHLLDPNPFFNSVYICMVDYGVFVAGVDPLVSFLQKHIFNNRNPSLFFDACHYIAKNPDVLKHTYANVLVHYYEGLHNEKSIS